jgi:hypothetical protein
MTDVSDFFDVHCATNNNHVLVEDRIIQTPTMISAARTMLNFPKRAHVWNTFDFAVMVRTVYMNMFVYSLHFTTTLRMSVGLVTRKGSALSVMYNKHLLRFTSL